MGLLFGNVVDHAALAANGWMNKGKYFSNGFGDMDALAKGDELMRLGADAFPDILLKEDKEWSAEFNETSKTGAQVAVHKRYEFESPIAEFLVDEEDCRTGVVEIVFPVGQDVRGVVAVLPMTGDAGFSYRRNKIAIPLAEKGYVSLLPIGPYMGKRKPSSQTGVFCNTVSEYLTHCWGSCVECAKLLDWARETYAGKPVGVAGTSVGGSFACMTAVFDIGDLAVIAYVPANSAENMLKFSVDLKSFSNKEELRMTLAERTISKFAENSNTISRQPLGRKLRINLIHAKKDVICPVNPNAKLIEEAFKDIKENAEVIKEIIPGGHMTSISRADKFLVPRIVKAMEESVHGL